MPAPGYVFLPHTTDAFIQATGSTLEEAFEYAAMGLFDTMCDLKSISPDVAESVQVNGDDEITLLYNWLESLLLKFELEHKVYSKFEVNLAKNPTGSIRANGRIFGEEYDRGKHGAKVEVKAVAFHKMEVTQEGPTTIVRFILDL